MSCTNILSDDPFRERFRHDKLLGSVIGTSSRVESVFGITSSLEGDSGMMSCLESVTGTMKRFENVFGAMIRSENVFASRKLRIDTSVPVRHRREK
jgi:hypothetical protein